MCIYKERHLVECFINKIKQYRRISSGKNLAQAPALETNTWETARTSRTYESKVFGR